VRSRLVALLGLALGGAACQWLVTLDADGPALVQREAGGAEAGPTDPCGAIPPPPDNVSDAGSDADLDITLAATYFGYDNVGREDFLCAQSGLDLDGLNSSAADCTPFACQPLAGSEKNRARCDGPNGADNAFASILKDLSAVLAQNNSTLNQLAPALTITRGVMNFLIELRGYNGTPNDDRVDIDVWTASGITGMQQPASFEIQDLEKLEETWDGGDPNTEWTVDSRSVKTDGTKLVIPKVVARGYVADGILVAPHMGQITLPPFVGSPVQVNDAELTGKLFQKDGRWQLVEGRVAARVESGRLLNILGATKATDSAQMCDPGSALYPLLRQELCTSLDLPPDGGAVDAGVPCGAISAGFAISFIESKITYQETNGFRAPVTGTSRFHGRPACPDDAGTVFCDDCSWAQASRCPPDPLQ
jgi:hypothetical protein